MSATGRSIVYVSCSKGACIEVLALDRATGELTPIETVALAASGMPLAISPTKHFLFAAVSADVDGSPEPRYALYHIDQNTGRLRHGHTIKAPGRMSHITVDRSGGYLLGASVANDLIASTAINIDGTLNPDPVAIHPVPSKAHQITTDLSNTYAYVPNLGADLVSQLKFDADTGTFADNTPNHITQPEGAAPRHIAHHPGGHYAYLLNEENGSIAAFKIAPQTGTLEQFQTSSFLPDNFDGKPWGAQILITSDGRFLYASDRTSSTLWLHTIDPDTGHMTKRQSWPTETCPRNFALDPSCHYLIAAGETSNRVTCYAIDQDTGSLAEKSSIATGAGPLWIEILDLD